MADMGIGELTYAEQEQTHEETGAPEAFDVQRFLDDHSRLVEMGLIPDVEIPEAVLESMYEWEQHTISGHNPSLGFAATATPYGLVSEGSQGIYGHVSSYSTDAREGNEPKNISKRLSDGTRLYTTDDINPNRQFGLASGEVTQEQILAVSAALQLGGLTQSAEEVMDKLEWEKGDVDLIIGTTAMPHSDEYMERWLAAMGMESTQAIGMPLACNATGEAMASLTDGSLSEITGPLYEKNGGEPIKVLIVGSEEWHMYNTAHGRSPDAASATLFSDGRGALALTVAQYEDYVGEASIRPYREGKLTSKVEYMEEKVKGCIRYPFTTPTTNNYNWLTEQLSDPTKLVQYRSPSSVSMPLNPNNAVELSGRTAIYFGNPVAETINQFTAELLEDGVHPKDIALWMHNPSEAMNGLIEKLLKKWRCPIHEQAAWSADKHRNMNSVTLMAIIAAKMENQRPGQVAITASMGSSGLVTVGAQRLG